MSFVDQVRIHVKAGDGGRGLASFRREKHVPKGGPDGGDGGDGGSVVLVAEPSLGSLSPYVRRRRQEAKAGGDGGANNRKGAEGPQVTLAVPVGTVVRDTRSGETLADLAKPGARYVAARGGRGGRGNAALKSPQDRVPNFAEQGEPGEEAELELELHLVADVGLLGPPNAGKSTLLAAISRAQPKIGDYPFTTLEPGLGVVSDPSDPDRRYTVADLPGLIQGASQGKGLGLRFLRHADRCSVLAAVVDLAADDPVGDLEAVVGEAEAYEPALAERVRVVVGNKTDIASADVDAAASWSAAHGARFVPISAATGSNVDELRTVLADEVTRAHAELGAPASFAVYRPAVEDRIVVVREDGAFRVRSERVERVVAQTPLGNSRAVRRLQRKLRAMGVETALRREGATDGADVRIGEAEFEWTPDDA
jgi:GTP-binding protein